MLSFGWFCLLWLLIFGGVSTFIGMKWGYGGDCGVSTFVISFIVSCVLLVWCSISYAGTKINMTNTTITEEKLLLSLSDSSNSNTQGMIIGSVFFTYGQIQSKTDTFYRTIAGDNVNGFQMIDLDIKDTKLFFIGDKTQPKLVTETQHLQYKYKKNWLVGGLINMDDDIGTADKLLGYKLYIPDSAAVIEFNVDME